MGLFNAISNPPPPFWSRGVVLWSLAGLATYGVSRWLFLSDSTAVLVFTGIFRLVPVLAVARVKPAWPIAIAAPYPYELAFAAYSHRGQWLPDNLAMEMSSPTGFLIFMGASLFLSIVVTGWLVSKTLPVQSSGHLRTLMGWLFGLTALAILLPLPQWGMFVMQNAAEPFALAGFAAIIGFAVRTRPQSALH